MIFGAPSRPTTPLLHDRDILATLEARFGRAYVARRLSIEARHALRVQNRRRNVYHPENWYRLPGVIERCLKLVGMHGRARRNARRIVVRENDVSLAHLPRAFDGYTLLHLTDLHVDINDTIAHDIADVVRDLAYDACVLTGDYRAATAGAIDATIDGMRRVCAVLREPIFGVLGNHDSLRMVPALDEMGVQTLINESVEVRRGTDAMCIAGIDDAHFFGADDIVAARAGVDPDRVSVLLSHTPEVYDEAAAAGFDLMLSGHTHGGQICLPGGVPIILDARLPRRLGRGAWRVGRMHGYTSAGAGTSIIDARINCPPEVVLHRLRAV